MHHAVLIVSIFERIVILHLPGLCCMMEGPNIWHIIELLGPIKGAWGFVGDWGAQVARWVLLVAFPKVRSTSEVQQLQHPDYAVE